MFSSTIKNLPKQTAELEITIPWDEVKSSYEKIFSDIGKEVEIEGFRKGKAPKKMLTDKIDKTKLYQEVIKEVVPKAYSASLSEHKLTPVSNPKIEIIKAKEGEDWAVKVTLALKPVINLKKYQEKIKELKKGQTKIWTPGQKTDKDKAKDNKLNLDQLLEALDQETEIELSDLLVNEETNRLLSNLLDQTQKLGLTVEQYLLAKGKTSQSLQQEYRQQAQKNLKIEFVLNEIADKEGISVSKEDIDNLIAKVEKPEEKARLQKDSYYLAHLLRQQKTLDFIQGL